MSHASVFNMDEALERVDQDRETFQMMTEIFLEQGPKDLREAQAALSVGDLAALARSSHRLKGAILQFCAPAALAACKELEEVAKAGNQARAAHIYPLLERELSRLLAALQDVLDQGMAA